MGSIEVGGCGREVGGISKIDLRCMEKDPLEGIINREGDDER